VAANSTGVLKNLAVFLVPPASVPAGQTDVAVIKLKSVANASGTTKIDLSNLQMLNPEGREISVTATGGQVEVSASAAVLPAGSLPSTGGPAGNPSSVWLVMLLGGFGLLSTAAIATYLARRP
jgi:hypothetical protein